MQPEDPNTTGIPVSETIRITRRDIEGGRSRKGYAGYLTGAVIAAVLGGLLAGLLFSGGSSTTAWLVGGASAVAIFGLAALAAYRGWIKLGITRPATRPMPSIDRPLMPVILPPVVVRPEDIPDPSESVTEAIPEAPATEAEQQPKCPFCGEALGERPAHICRYCQTPHHQECWTANGGCTTFGCRANTRS